MQKAIINTEKSKVSSIIFYFCDTKVQLFDECASWPTVLFCCAFVFLKKCRGMMNLEKGKLRPQVVFDCFEQINKVPRPSKKEEKMIEFLLDFGQSLGLESKRDKAGNVLIRKPATPGYEDRKPLVLQSHMDMVCEKNRNVTFDFEKDAIQTFVDGEWLRAKGTTLGADDGIGVAMEMAILQSNDIAHGPIECLFTRDEETGLTGAMGLEPGFMSGDFLINLDSEDEGQIFVSCAGGARTTATFTFDEVPVPDGYYTCKITVKGLTGGHSGDDINKKRANANKLLVRFLHMLLEKYSMLLVDIQSGGLHNAIPREGFAVVAVPLACKEDVRRDLNMFAAAVEEEYAETEPNLKFEMESETPATSAIEPNAARKMILGLLAVYNGIEAYSQELEGLVETSTNLASIHKEGNQVLVNSSQRSSIGSKREYMSAVVRAALELAGAKTETNEGYPGWKMNPDSQLLKIAKDSYVKLFGKEPEIRAIHAGLECGLFSEKYPHLDMISFGPTLRGVHSPDERLLIPTVDMVWRHLLDIMAHIPVK